MASKKYSVAFSSGEIVRVDVHKNKEGYNYASVGVKKGQDNYMNVGYEWRGDKTPDFVMDVMAYFSSDMAEKASVEVEDGYEAFLARLKEGI